MHDRILFSVLVANYNNGQYLEECLQSIFAQTYKNWEIVIVDDASTDNSHIIYEKYKSASRIKIVKNDKNRGCGYTKRKCVEMAKGEICGFVDPDDSINPEAIEIMVKAHADNPDHSIIYSTHYICDEHLRVQKVADNVGQIPEGHHSCSMKRPVISHFVSFKLKKYNQTKGISSFYTKAVDKDLYYKLEETGPVLFNDKPLYFYRHHAGGISLNQNTTEAYQFELTAKVQTILRNKKNRQILSDMDQKKPRLVTGILNVAQNQLKQYKLSISLYLLFQSFCFSPFNTIKVIGKKILKFILSRKIIKYA